MATAKMPNTVIEAEETFECIKFANESLNRKLAE